MPHLSSSLSEPNRIAESSPWLMQPTPLLHNSVLAVLASASLLLPTISRAEASALPPAAIKLSDAGQPSLGQLPSETRKVETIIADGSILHEQLSPLLPTLTNISTPPAFAESEAEAIPFPALPEELPSDLPEELQDDPVGGSANEDSDELDASATPELTGPSSEDASSIVEPVFTPEVLQVIQLNGLSNTAQKYPWIVNPSDGLVLKPNRFNPLQTRYYTDFKTQIGPDGMSLERVMLGDYKPEDQNYRVLPGNRIIFETEGWNVGLSEQGQSLDIGIRQLIRRRMTLWGLQAAWSIPQIPTDDRQGFEGQDLEDATIISIAGEISNPDGAPVSSNDIQLITPESAQVGRSSRAGRTTDTTDILSTSESSTFHPRGGISLFENLDDKRAPVILQAFPTNNLQPLFEGLPLVEGVTIPEANFEAAGLRWSDPLTGLGGSFAPELTSVPGIKIAKANRFDNQDLLQVLVNPSLEQAKRDYHYLNSLHWVSLGEKQPKQLAQVSNQSDESNSDWQRAFLSRTKRQSLLQYSGIDAEATYISRFSGPGGSTSFSFEAGDIDRWQTTHATAGLMLGGLFEFLPQAHLDQGLADAEALAHEPFSPLDTVATKAERQQINRRLNQTLSNLERSSSLSQLSGSLSLLSRVTPQQSHQLEVRTGLHQRRVQFLGQDIRWELDDPYVSNLRTGNEDFGRLTFIGSPLPSTNVDAINASDTALDNASSAAPNTASKAEVTVIQPNGKQFTQQLTSDRQLGSLEGFPVSVRQADLTFDRIELTRLDRRTISVGSYRGFLELPSAELAWSGSSGEFDYNVNVGSWFNFAPETAPGVISNTVGEREPGFGVYLGAAAGHTRSQVQQNDDGQVIAVTTSRPLVRLQVNSALNSDNPAFASASYTWSRQSRDLQLALVPGIIVSNDGKDWQPLSFLQGRLGLKSGLTLNANLEYGDDWFAKLQANQRLSDRWSVGGYIQNFRSSQQVLKGRLSENSAGLSVKHQLYQPGSSIEGKLGISQAGVEFRLEGKLGF